MRSAVTLGGCVSICLLLAGCGGSPSANRASNVVRHEHKQVGDTEEANSSPLPAGAARPHAAPRPASVSSAATTAASVSSSVSPGAPSDAEVRAELREMKRATGAEGRSATSSGGAMLDANGDAQAPIDAPGAITNIVLGGNAIAHYPYVYGGGHKSFVDTAYDCSASVSYALAAAGLLDRPLTSGELANWGEPGPGHWVTIYANAGHTFMYVAGLRFDTSGRTGRYGSRWQSAPRSLKGFVVRHPAGL